MENITLKPAAEKKLSLHESLCPPANRVIRGKKKPHLR